MRGWVFGMALLAAAGPAWAAVQGQSVDYQDGETTLEGYLAYDDAVVGPRPGILVVHEWMGLGEYAKHRADQLAQLGYVALAADIYGKGVRAHDHEEAGKLAGAYKGNRQLMRGRITAALEQLKRDPRVDPERIAAIGYCFGGTTVLELARSGAEVSGVVSFHGALATPSPAAPGAVRARVLVFHGGADPHVTPDEVAAFKREMEAAGADFRVVVYDRAVHSFTVPAAGNDPSKGAAYDPEADAASWEAMNEFFDEIFAHSEVRHVG